MPTYWTAVRRRSIVFRMFDLCPSQPSIVLASGTAPNQPQQPQVAIDGAGGSTSSGRGLRQLPLPVHGQRPAFFQLELPPIKSMSLGMPWSARCRSQWNGLRHRHRQQIQRRRRRSRGLPLLTDRGQRWSSPVTINDEPASAAEGLHAMAAGPGCAASGLISAPAAPRGSALPRPATAGPPGSKNIVVYQSPDGPVCPCCHPSVTFDDKGGIYVMWRNCSPEIGIFISSGSRPMVARRLVKAAKLGQGTWPRRHARWMAVRSLHWPRTIATAWRREKKFS